MQTAKKNNSQHKDGCVVVNDDDDNVRLTSTMDGKGRGGLKRSKANAYYSFQYPPTPMSTVPLQAERSSYLKTFEYPLFAGAERAVVHSRRRRRRSCSSRVEYTEKQMNEWAN